MRHSTKKRKLDEIDIYANNSRFSIETENLLASSISNDETTNYSYWTSPEARRTFSPIDNEEVLSCLTRCIRMLSDATLDDNSLLSLLPDLKDIKLISSFQRQTFSHQCFYLRKLYKIPIQKMNSST